MKQKLIYAGVGSRSTPTPILRLMCDFARLVAEQGDWLLRSGGAIGADLAFELGCNEAKGRKEIYLTYPRKQGWSSKDIILDPSKVSDIIEYYREHGIMDSKHIGNLSPDARKLHARNYYQVMGLNEEPADLVVCWTEKGQEVGGTRTAIRLAKSKGIMVKNLGLPEVESEVRAFVLKNS